MTASIITVSYNSQSTIEDTISTTQGQQSACIEHVFVDGASSDGTVALVEAKVRKGDVFISEPDDGLYDAMNKGIGLASGDIIGILHSDDFYYSDKVIRHVVDTFESTGCDAVYGNLEFVDAVDTDKVIRVWKSSPFHSGSFRKGWHPPHPTFFVKREIYEKYGSFDTTFNISADFELMLRFIEKHRIHVEYLDEVLVRMRYGGESTGSLKKIIEGNRNVLRAFKKNGIPVSPLYPVLRLLPKLKQFIIKPMRKPK